jgi:galacturan 1,4-alpha-galacturonidase
VGLNGGSVSNLKMRYSPQYYNIIINSTDVIYDNIDISGGSVSENEAKNTDGWYDPCNFLTLPYDLMFSRDTYRSDRITIQNSVINNGDGSFASKD